MTLLSSSLIIVLLCVCFYFRLRKWGSLGAFLVLLIGINWFDSLSASLFIVNIVYLAIAIFLCVSPLRKMLFTQAVFKLFKSKLPKISETERVVLDAGNTWWEKELFCGSPNWNQLHEMPAAKLTGEEQSFVDHQVDQLCEMIQEDSDPAEFGLSENIWSYLKQEKFFGMVVEKEYGGLGFSAIAHSAVIKKIATRNISAAVVVMVPNSLGPAELITCYGTDSQKQHYLPRLADGREIPCFGLTATEAGSDATSLTDSGVVCRGQFNGEEIIGIRLNFCKRYITLAPIATLLGLAFKLTDPDNLLGQGEELGLNIAMLPMNLNGIDNNSRHWPMKLDFPNGPVTGIDVFIPLDYLLGGEDMLGKGWNMLVERLSIGRAISLPSLSAAAGSMAFVTAGAYAKIRKQFGVNIGSFEGVREKLAEIAGFSYMIDAVRKFTTSAVDQGVSPSLASAIAKYHTTEMQRVVLNHSMDIHAGKAIQTGPKNYLLKAYLGVPISITVEGANILTRSLIIFGQGAMRCHPHLLDEIRSAESNDITKFDTSILQHAAYLVSNCVKSFVMGLTSGLFIRNNEDRSLKRYYQKLTRMSVVLALVSDLTSITLGAALKRKESLSGRLGDVLSYLYMSSAVLKVFKENGNDEQELEIVKWCLQSNLVKINRALYDVFANFPNRYLGMAMRFITFPLGQSGKNPSVELANKISQFTMENSSLRQKILSDCYYGDSHVGLSEVNQAFMAVLETEVLEKKLKRAIKDGEIGSSQSYTEQLHLAQDKDILSHEEVISLKRTKQLVDEAIKVDSFSIDLKEIRA